VVGLRGGREKRMELGGERGMERRRMRGWGGV